MSHVVPQTTTTSRLHLGRHHFAALIAVLVVAAAISVALIASSRSGDSQSTAQSTPSAQLSGPNEAARGQAAATASGVPSAPSLGGPDETARGQAVHSAAR
jgi:hypothetical protein